MKADPSSFLSVVLVTYDSAPVIVSAIESVHAQLPRAEVIVVDNGSTDATRTLLSNDRVARVCDAGANLGFGTAVNIGARASSRRLILVLNPDARVIRVEAPKLLDLCRQTPTGLVGLPLRQDGATTDALIPIWPWRAELAWALLSWFLTPRELSLQRPRFARTRHVWIAGAAFIVAREEFLDLGGFDENIFLYYEDFDLAWRYAAGGYRVWASDAVRIDHVGLGSSPRDNVLIMTWSLLSLLETTSTWRGMGEATRAARTVLRWLRGIELTGTIGGSIPRFGARAREKGGIARRVRTELHEAARSGSTTEKYPYARRALRDATLGSLRETG